MSKPIRTNKELIEIAAAILERGRRMRRDDLLHLALQLAEEVHAILSLVEIAEEEEPDDGSGIWD